LFLTAPEELTGPGICVAEPALPSARVDCRFLDHVEIVTLIPDSFAN
jgi:hypothetical protein